MAFANINGTVLHHEYLTEDDNAPVLILINSLGSDFRIWLPLLDELDTEWSILLYDKRGHGLSDVGALPYSIEDHADDLIGLCRHLGIRKATICGLSVGGLIAQSVYLKKPELVRKIVLSNTSHKIGTEELWATRIAAVEEGGVEPLADAVLERWFTPDFHQTRKTDLAGYRNMLVRQDRAGYAATCGAIRDADFTASVSEIKVPVLCIAGDQDGSTPPDMVRATAGMIPNARFELIEGCGHIPCIEQPAALADILDDFINA